MRRLKLTTLTAAGIAFGTFLPLAAQAQMVTSREGIALQNQILELQHQIQAMKQQQGGGGNGGSVLGAPPPLQSQNGGAGSSSALVPSLLEQVQTLNAQVQDLRGRVDRLEHEVATQSGEINQEIGNLKFQLSQGGQGGFGAQPGQTGAAQPGMAQPAPGQAAPAAQTVPGRPKAMGAPAPGTLGTLPRTSPSAASPAKAEHHAAMKPQEPPPAPAAKHAAPVPKGEVSLKAARAALAHHDYKAAEVTARAIIAKKGRGADHGAAELVLADALARQGRYQEAAIAYDDAYNASHSGPYAPDALLGLANSLSAIHQNQEACDTLDSLQSQFSSPSASLAARIRAARHRAHCG